MRSVYVAGLGHGDGLQVVELGLMELLARRVERLGVFRPVAPRGADLRVDPAVELMRARYRPAHVASGVTLEEAEETIAAQATGALLDRLAERFAVFEAACDAVLVLGGSSALGDLAGEPAFDAKLAARLSSPVVIVAGGVGQDDDVTSKSLRIGYQAFVEQGCPVLAVIANRVPAGAVVGADLPVPCYVIPENAALSAPTVAQVADVLRAVQVQGDAASLLRDVSGVLLAGETLPGFLDHLRPGCLVVTPGDRTDLLLGAAAADAAGTARPAAVVLSNGVKPTPAVRGLTARLAPGLPVLSAAADSFAVADAVTGLPGSLSADNPRRTEQALGHFESHVDSVGLAERLGLGRPRRVTPLMFEQTLIERARAERRHIVLPEGEEDRVLRAAEAVLRRGIADLTLLGREDVIRRRAGDHGLDLQGAKIVDPLTSPMRHSFAERYHALREHRGVTVERARDMVTDANHFATMMVRAGVVHGMVSGTVHSSAATLLPAFQIIQTVPDISTVSSVYFMCLADRVLLFGDCAVNAEPDVTRLADIAISSARTAARFGIEPRVAMLSYSAGALGARADVDKVQEATDLVRSRVPELLVEGPIQYDVAVDPRVAAARLPESRVAGQATVLVFPDQHTGANTCLAVRRSAGAVAVGPILQGLQHPVNDLARGADVEEIVTTIAITAIQAQGL
ncbi:phosphate acetyltransferase [Sinosporangium siamense]|uniref:Phosphate acetyltransferase n=1 Tax=Sinosporangium siamense TaxID=1367973 RepID=A0A919RFK4_9ACTN|nr:phosphate acetyltransferase [Sinosporangium siamense]GII92723.1 phosphate acetyltransferase [Sinosporangium siamense]